MYSKFDEVNIQIECNVEVEYNEREHFECLFHTQLSLAKDEDYSSDTSSQNSVVQTRAIDNANHNYYNTLKLPANNTTRGCLSIIT